MQQTTLTEHIQDWRAALHVDASERLVRNVALAGAASRNGYRYAESALADAAGLYESKPVFLDHSANRAQPLDRSTRDLVGSVVHARYEDGRLRGDIRVLATESGETFLKLVESETPGVGMSHVVLAQRSPDGKTVERITDVLSVDVVVNPATTSTFREACQNESPDTIEQLEQLRAERDELDRELTSVRHELSQLRAQESVRRLAAESGLPQDAITPCFLEQLLAAPTLPMRHALIQDRASLLTRSPRTPAVPRSQERAAVLEDRLSDERFVRALRGR